MNLLLKLRENSKLTESEQKIADYVIQNYDVIKNYTCCDLAKVTFSSPAGITRLCKKIGIKGYKEFRIKLAEEVSILNNNQIDIDKSIDITKEDNVKSIIHKLNRISIDTLNETKLLQDEENILKITKLLQDAKSIHFYGQGASYMVALDAMYKFMRVGKSTTAHNMTDFQYVQAKNSTKDDVAVIISYSGETQEMIDIANILIENRVKIVSITKNRKNTIAKLSDFNLFVTSKEKLERSSAIYSRISMLNVIDIIYFTYFNATYDVSKKMIENNKISKKKNK